MDFKKMLRNTASSLGLAIGAMSKPPEQAQRPRGGLVTRKRGKKGTPYGHYCAYRREGPIYKQVGDNLVPTFKHHFLHARKGWRTYSEIPLGIVRLVTAR